MSDAESESETTVSQPGEAVVTVNENEMRCNKYGSIIVGYMLPDGSFSLKSRCIFKPKAYVAFAGHANVLDGSTIHLCPGSESESGSILISAGTSNDGLGEVCLWRLNADNCVSGELRRQNTGAVTVITTCGKYLFVGRDNGRLSAYRIEDGRQIEFNGPEFANAIDDLLVIVKESGAMYGLVVTGGLACELEIEEQSDSEITYAYRFCTLEPFAYSVEYDRETRKFLLGTSGGNLHIDRFDEPVLDNEGDENDNADSNSGPTGEDKDGDKMETYCPPQILTSVKKFIFDQCETCYLGLKNGELQFYDITGQEVQKKCDLLTKILGKADLQVVTYRKRTYFLVSGTMDSHYSAIFLYNDNLMCLAEYKLRAGETITAFNMMFVDHKETGLNSHLILVGGSDGILRYLKWNPLDDRNELELVGCLPVGKIITKICPMTTSSFALGYANGDLGLYRFI